MDVGDNKLAALYVFMIRFEAMLHNTKAEYLS